MSETAQSLSQKISGAGELQGVVRSMKALAASSISQYQRAVVSLEDYYRTLELGLSACFRTQPEAPVFAGRSGAEPLVGAVVFGSDQGLVGGFNEAVSDFAKRTLDASRGELRLLWPVGQRVSALLKDTGLNARQHREVPGSVNAITSLVQRLLVEIGAAVDAGKVLDVYVFHNHPTSADLYEPVCRQLIPLDDTWRKKLLTQPWPTKTVPEVINGVAPTLQALVRDYLFVLLFQACAESLAGENSSRLAAMQRAEKNIESMLDDLNRNLHRVRQTSIDEELFDVIAGFEALRKHVRS